MRNLKTKFLQPKMPN